MKRTALAENIVKLANAADAAGKTEVADIYDRELLLLQRRSAGELTKKAEDSAALDAIETALSVAGFIPGIGDIADLAAAGIAMYRGDIIGACLSLISMLPGVGDAAAKPIKFALKAGNKLPLDKIKPIMNIIASNKANLINKVRQGAAKISAIGPQRAEKLATAVSNAFLRLEQKLKDMVTVDAAAQATTNMLRSVPGVEAGEKKLYQSVAGKSLA